MPQSTKPKRAPKYGPKVITMLRHLMVHGPSTQEELLSLVRPKFNTISVKVPLSDPRVSDAEKRRAASWNEDFAYILVDDVSRPKTSKDRWGNAYFIQPPAALPVRPYAWRSDHRASLIVRGLVEKTKAKKGRAFTYAITPYGVMVLSKHAGV